ncbi:hypothetical protein GCM10020367_36500 [Streptomyces sannanensis]|uniref:Uncharacterized protein n=1 Tax=Streptomyces sannanensis TaxID=285536 RepID=A0ABP6SDF0_9ACTN
MYTIEMAYARMRQLQDEANRSRAARPFGSASRLAPLRARFARGAKKN